MYVLDLDSRENVYVSPEDWEFFDWIFTSAIYTHKPSGARCRFRITDAARAGLPTSKPEKNIFDLMVMMNEKKEED